MRSARACHFGHDKHVLIIGATGFLGGWITRHLVDDGAKVACLVRSQRPLSQLSLTDFHRRDFLYVDEAAKAHLMFAERLSSDPSLRGEVFNFSHGVGISVLDLTRRITAMMGSSLEPEILGTAKGEISRIQVDSTKAITRLQWKPPDFSASLASTVNWYRDNLPQLKL